ncbi:MAG: hypothetical protein MZW92_72060 [Comamonadaceae bacterium]|nr:hypothetical protein [Comamonadaceae bacterium]
MVAQAALETGWGRKEIRHADGAPSFNLFGIKAGADWTRPGGRGHDHRVRRRPAAARWWRSSAPTAATPSRSPTTRG